MSEEIKEEYWGSFNDDYNFVYGGYASVEEAIEDMVNDYWYYHDDHPDDYPDISFYIGKRVDFVPEVDEERVIEQIDNDAYMFFEMADIFPDDMFASMTREQQDELQQMLTDALRKWMNKNNLKYCDSLITDIEEYNVMDYSVEEDK